MNASNVCVQNSRPWSIHRSPTGVYLRVSEFSNWITANTTATQWNLEAWFLMFKVFAQFFSLKMMLVSVDWDVSEENIGIPASRPFKSSQAKLFKLYDLHTWNKIWERKFMKPKKTCEEQKLFISLICNYLRVFSVHFSFFPACKGIKSNKKTYFSYTQYKFVEDACSNLFHSLLSSATSARFLGATWFKTLGWARRELYIWLKNNFFQENKFIESLLNCVDFLNECSYCFCAVGCRSI